MGPSRRRGFALGGTAFVNEVRGVKGKALNAKVVYFLSSLSLRVFLSLSLSHTHIHTYISPSPPSLIQVSLPSFFSPISVFLTSYLLHLLSPFLGLSESFPLFASLLQGSPFPLSLTVLFLFPRTQALLLGQGEKYFLSVRGVL